MFRPDTDLMKNYFMLSMYNQELQFNDKKSEVLQQNNPQSRVYIIGVKLTDFFFKEFGTKKYGFYSNTVFCIVSKFPFFEFHRKVLMLINSNKKLLTKIKERIKNWRLNLCMKLNDLGTSKVLMLKYLDFASALNVSIYSKRKYIHANNGDNGLSEVQKDMFKLLEIRCKNYEEMTEFGNEFYRFDYRTPAKLISLHSEAIAFFEPCFRSMNFYEFYFILISILEEKYVVLVSENIQLLTSCM
jgi:hypothetical protein